MSATPEDGGLSAEERRSIQIEVAALRAGYVHMRDVFAVVERILAARAAAPDEVGGDPCGGLAPGDESLPLAANVDPLPGSADAERRIAAAAAPDALRAQGVNEGIRLAAQLVRDHMLGDTGQRVAAFLEGRADRALLDDPAPAGRPTGGAA